MNDDDDDVTSFFFLQNFRHLSRSFGESRQNHGYGSHQALGGHRRHIRALPSNQDSGVAAGRYRRWVLVIIIITQRVLFYINCFSSFAGRTAENLKAFLCQSDWWDHSFTIRKLPAHFITLGKNTRESPPWADSGGGAENDTFLLHIFRLLHFS